jgi:GNAT superfamily N-acetyltransferase
VIALATDATESVLFNRALGVGLDRPADDTLLDAIQAHFAPGGRDHSINLCPAALPTDLPERLRSRGYGCYFHWIKWWRDASPAPGVATSLRVTRAGADVAAHVAAVGAAGFGLAGPMRRTAGASVGRPGWHHFLAWDGDTPVASGGLFVRGDTGWLGGATTLPDHRGRGAQQALIAARIDAAREAGCTLLAVETGPDSEQRPNPSYRNMAKLGFHIAYERPSWVYPDPGLRGA